MNNNKILYVFGPGRVKRLNQEIDQPLEFFYGYQYFNKKYSTNIIEVNKSKFNLTRFKKLLFFYDRLIVKLTSFPSYAVELISIKNYKIYKNSKKIIFTNDALYLSFLPILFLTKLFKYKNQNFVITMGLFGKDSLSKYKKLFDLIYKKIFLYTADKFIFIGYGEYDYAIKKYSKYRKKFEYIPFGIDTNFWSTNNIQKKEGIVFVGNDGKRDYEFLKELTKQLEYLHFTLVTDYPFDIKLKNVTVIKGSWSKQLISDSALRSIYENSKLTIVPLKDSLQPSGQSVTLQSISCKTPVLISKTEGFFGDRKFINNFKINFVDINTTEHWKEKIDYLLSSYEDFRITDEDLVKFKKIQNLQVFEKNLEKVIFNL